jgi:hypothetical protein
MNRIGIIEQRRPKERKARVKREPKKTECEQKFARLVLDWIGDDGLRGKEDRV